MTTALIFQNASTRTISQASSTQPSITIASLVWWPGSQPASAKKRLNSIQTLAPFGITWAMHTALSAMEELSLAIPPWNLWFKERCASHQLMSLGCSSYLNPNQEHMLFVHSFEERIPHLVGRNTTVLQKFSTTYCVNTLHLFYRN